MNKYCFAVCDDEKEIRTLFCEWLSESGYNADIKEYACGDELISDIDNGAKPDILFLDIAMDGSDGIETAKELSGRIEKMGRSMRASRPLIIYVTGIPDRMGDAFSVKAYGYLLKPVSRAAFDAELHRAVEELEKLDAQMLCETMYRSSRDDISILQTGKEVINVKNKDILFIESSGRKSVVHIKSRCYEIYKQMAEFEKELGPAFFRTHRGYLVNMRHVKGYTRTEVYLDDGSTVLISKYKYAEFVKAYMDFIS